MKPTLANVLSFTVMALMPLTSLAKPAVRPVAELYCGFNSQEGLFRIQDNPNEAVAYVMLEEEGLCAFGTASIDENERVHFDIAIYDSCFLNKLAQTPQSKIPDGSRKYLNYKRPSDGKTFTMACAIL